MNNLVLCTAVECIVYRCHRVVNDNTYIPYRCHLCPYKDKDALVQVNMLNIQFSFESPRNPAQQDIEDVEGHPSSCITGCCRLTKGYWEDIIVSDTIQTTEN